MFEANFANEAVKVFQYIKDELIRKYPTGKVTIEYFMLSVLENEDSVAYQILSRTTLVSTLNAMHDWFVRTISKPGNMVSVNKGNIEYDSIFNKCVEVSNNELKTSVVTTGHLLLAILKLNEGYNNQFKQIGITYEQLLTNLKNILPPDIKNVNNNMTVGINYQPSQKGAVEELLINVNELAANGKIDDVIGNDDIITNIFNALSKRDRNNVVVVGDSGVGKTATVLHMANLLVKGKVPEAFKNRKLMKFDFISLVTGSALRGAFEAKFNAIVSDAVKKDGYIFFIDDMESILSEKTRLSEVDTQKMIEMLLMERNIKFICTMDNRSYTSYIRNTQLRRRFQKIEMTGKSLEETINIVKYCKEKYEKYHNVKFTDKAIETCVRLSNEYVKDVALLDYAIDLLDEIGAKKTLTAKEDNRVTKQKNRLSAVKQKIRDMDKSTERKNYDEYDKLKNEELKLKSELKIIEKDVIFNTTPVEITEDDIREMISFKTNIPVTKLSDDERNKLKTLNNSLKQYIIGQDNAVDEVCRVVKRQRIGMADNNRPAVLFFAGSTGTGKTYLAKKLAQEVFGSEKNMVRLDMSEYSDKMSVSKLSGSSPGYIGYDKGGILTEAIKKNNHCVLLLDEMEKADEEVHNVFLQIFDEGRLTDNMGITVDFSNVIVIMTSNVGAREISDKGNGIGFVKDVVSDNREMIEKAMKKKFKPEFINRIDSIVHFNRLSDDDIRNIIRLEIGKLNGRLEKIEYRLGESFNGDECIEYIYKKIKDKSEYGARPVIHILQREIEDRITDYIVDNQPEKGYVFETNIIQLPEK